jgi:hypothetical protein
MIGKVSTSLLTLGALLVAGLVLAPVALSGCGSAGSGSKEAELKPYFKMKVVRVEQLHRIGAKHADGQYLKVLLNVLNDSNKDQTIKPAEMQLKRKGETEEETSMQPVEDLMRFDYAADYGRVEASHLIEGVDTIVHPHMAVERTLIYQVPDDADLTRYSVFYKPGSGMAIFAAASGPSPFEVEAKLVTVESEIIDRRTAGDNLAPNVAP